MMRQLNSGEAKEGDVVFYKRLDGSFQESMVKYVEDRGFYNILHTSRILKNGRVTKKVSTSSEDDFYVPE